MDAEEHELIFSEASPQSAPQRASAPTPVAQVSDPRPSASPSASPSAWFSLRFAALTVLFVVRIRKVLSTLRRAKLVRDKKRLVPRVNAILATNRLKKIFKPQRCITLGAAARAVRFIAKLRRVYRRRILERHPVQLLGRVGNLVNRRSSVPLSLSLRVAAVVGLFLVRLLARTRARLAYGAGQGSLSLGSVARLRIRVRHILRHTQTKKKTFLGAAVRATVFLVKLLAGTRARLAYGRAQPSLGLGSMARLNIRVRHILRSTQDRKKTYLGAAVRACVFIVKLLACTRARLAYGASKGSGLGLGSVARLKFRVRHILRHTQGRKKTFMGSAVRATVFLVKLLRLRAKLMQAGGAGTGGALALVPSANGNSLDVMIHRHIGRYRGMLRSSPGDVKVQSHINKVIKTLESHVKMDHSDPVLSAVHDKYSRQHLRPGTGSRETQVTLPIAGVFAMLKDLGITKFVVSKEEVLEIFRFASEGSKNLTRAHFMTFTLNLARLMLSRPPHNVPLEECLDVFIAKYLARKPTLKPVRAASKAAVAASSRPEHNIFRLTIDQAPPTLQHFSPLLRPMPRSRALLHLVEAIRRRWTSETLKLLKSAAPQASSQVRPQRSGSLEASLPQEIPAESEDEDWGSDDFDDTAVVHATAEGQRLAEEKKVALAKRRPTEKQAEFVSTPVELFEEESLGDSNDEEETIPEVPDCPVRVFSRVDVKDMGGKKQKVPPSWEVRLSNGILKIKGQEEILFKYAEQTLGIVDAE